MSSAKGLNVSFGPIRLAARAAAFEAVDEIDGRTRDGRGAESRPQKLDVRLFVLRDFVEVVGDEIIGERNRRAADAGTDRALAGDFAVLQAMPEDTAQIVFSLEIFQIEGEVQDRNVVVDGLGLCGRRAGESARRNRRSACRSDANGSHEGPTSGRHIHRGTTLGNILGADLSQFLLQIGLHE